MKKITLLFILMVAFSITNRSQSFTELLNSNNVFNNSNVKARLIIAPFNKGELSVVSTYTNTAGFIADYDANCYNPAGLISENFDGGPSGIISCGSMISSAGDGCFAAGELEDGFNVTALGTGGNDVVFIPAAALGNTVALVGANSFVDYTILSFPDNDVFAVGSTMFFYDGNPIEYRVYGSSDVLLETYTLTGTAGTEAFFGFIADEIITKVEMQCANDGGDLFGELLFGICNPAPPPPANNDCEGAISVIVDPEGTGCYSPTVATNVSATGSSVSDPSCGLYNGGDVWYSFTAPSTGAVKIIVPVVGEWSSFSNAIYDACSSRTEIDCKEINGIDDPGNVPAEVFYNDLTPGTTYYIRAWDNNNDNIGEVSFCIEAYTHVNIEDIGINGFTYYPNPVSNALTLSSQDNIQNISVYNITGQLVISLNPNTNKTQIDMNKLVNGIYFVKALINDELNVFKVVKK